MREDGAEDGEEEGAEPERGEGKGSSGAPVMWPVESGRLDRGGKGHAASQARQVGAEAQKRNVARCSLIGDVKREVPQCKEKGAGEDSRSRSSINEDADRDAHSVHAEVAKQADEIALGGGQLQPDGELGRPC